MKKIPIEMNGSWVNIKVDVNLLLQALGLLPHDLFNNDIFSKYMHHKRMAFNAEDTDHVAAVLALSPLAIPVSLPAACRCRCK